MEEEVAKQAADPAQELAQQAEEIAEIGQGVLMQAEDFVESLWRPWSAYQLAILAGVILFTLIVHRIIAPRLTDWMREREGWPKWQLRILVVIRNRLRMILFVVFIWAVIFVMREITWPSRTYLLAAAGNLALAWLIVAFATRLISNPILRGIVRYGAWIWITLRILRLDDDAQQMLDTAAIQLGEMRLSLWLILQAVFILTLLFFGVRFVTHSAASKIKQSKDMSPSMQVLAVKVMQVILYGAAFFIGLKAVGVDLTGLAVLSGAIGVGLGFGLQKVVSNLVSGVIILLDKSIKPGDVISLGDTFGWINALGARYVSVVTRDGREYLIPNEDLITGQVVNWSHSNEFVRLDLFFGTAYHDDPHLVRRLAVDAALGVDRVLKNRAPVCHIVGFGDSSVDYILRFWISDPTGGLTNIKGNVFLALWDAFKEHEISIPFPQREVRLLGDEEESPEKPNGEEEARAPA